MQVFILCVCIAGLEKKVRELYDAVCRLEEEKYDWEGKLGRQTEEVCCLMLQYYYRVGQNGVTLFTACNF